MKKFLCLVLCMSIISIGSKCQAEQSILRMFLRAN